MATPDKNIWGDLLYGGVFTGAFVGVVIALEHWSLIPPLKTADIFVLVGAYLALAFSAVLNAYASDGYAYHRLGYDLCSLTLGTCLSLLAALALAKTDVLPNLGSVLQRSDLTGPHQAALVALMGFFSLLAMMFTAHIVKSLDGDSPPKGARALALFSFAIGFLMLYAYAFLLVGAGA